MEKFLALYQGSSSIWQMENRYRTMLDGNLIMVLQLIGCVKIYQFVLMKQQKWCNLPVTKIVDKYYEEVQKNGGIGLIHHPS